MKLLIQSALITVVVLGLATGPFGFQRVADWGQINPQGQEKAEFSWSRLAYKTAMGGGGYGGFGGGFGGGYGADGGTWSAGLPQGRPAIPDGAEPADADQGAVD